MDRPIAQRAVEFDFMVHHKRACDRPDELTHAAFDLQSQLFAKIAGKDAQGCTHIYFGFAVDLVLTQTEGESYRNARLAKIVIDQLGEGHVVAYPHPPHSATSSGFDTWVINACGLPAAQAPFLATR